MINSLLKIVFILVMYWVDVTFKMIIINLQTNSKIKLKHKIIFTSKH